MRVQVSRGKSTDASCRYFSQAQYLGGLPGALKVFENRVYRKGEVIESIGKVSYQMG